jgi:hypothetical protein
MEEKELTQWGFKKELKEMAVSCIGNKEGTAKKKAADLFEKYKGIISYSTLDRDWYKNISEENYLKFKALKNGYINYARGEDTKGLLLIKDIEQVEIRKEDVLIITKTGREVIMGKNFKWIEGLF